MPPTTLAFDFGGTGIDICRMSKTGDILDLDRVPTADLAPGDASFLERALDLIGSRLGPDDDKIGLSWNAPVHEGRLTQSSLLGGRISVDLAGRLRRAFDLEIQVESDVQAMVLGEYRFGLGAGAAPLLLVNLGSGAGIGYHDGRLMRGHSGGAGLVCNERRYVPQIGETVILDHLLSGRGVSRLYARLGGTPLPAVEVAARAATDPHAAAVFDIIAEQFGAYLITLARLFDPRSIVLAGSVAKAASLFLDRSLAILEAEIEPACRPERVVVSSLVSPACLGLA